MSRFIMYSTLGCHLCEEAQRVVVAVLGQPVLEIDIADDTQLLNRYEIRIPVLFDQHTERELGWPFDAADLRVWLDMSDERM